MLEDKRIEYDEQGRVLRYHSGATGDSLFSREEGLALSRLVRAGAWEGRTVDRVEVVFAEQATAQHNADPLQFLGLAAKGPEGLVTQETRFTAREDFGIKPE